MRLTLRTAIAIAIRDEEKTKLPVLNSCIHNLKDIVTNINGKFENAESLIHVKIKCFQ